MSATKKYPVSADFNLIEFVQRLDSAFHSKGYTVKVTAFTNSYIMSVDKNNDGFSKFLGLAESVKVTVSLVDGQLTIAFGDEEWTYKIVAAVIGFLFSGLVLPLALCVTSIIGILNQAELPNKISNEALKSLSEMPH